MSRRGSRLIALSIAGLAGVGAMVYSYLSLHPHPFEAPDHRAARLSRAHGITIAYGDPSTFYVPPYGPQDAIPTELKLTAALPENLSYALDGIEAALAKYPPGFVAGLVRAIFVAGEIQVHAEQSGGFTGPAWFVLAASNLVSKESIRLNALEGVHHELSSFVFRTAHVAGQWTAFAPQTWSFTTNNEVALSNGGRAGPSPDTGFLSAYGATTAENDFNTYAEKTFADPDALARLACDYPLIRKKLTFFVRTYVELDARMENVFRELGLESAHLCERSWRRLW